MDSPLGLANTWLDLIDTTRITVVIWEGDILVARTHALQFLDWLSSRGKVVLGAEGFVFDGEDFRPVEGCIAEYLGDDEAKSIDFHKQVIQHDDAWKNKPHFIEFTLKG